MRTPLTTLLILAACLAGLRAQTMNWGSEVFSEIVDSRGDTLDNTFVFEIGAFGADFMPSEANVADWHANWFAFDRAAYNADIGYFTSTADMNDDGNSDSPFMTEGAPSFEGLEAYLWIRNENLPGTTTDWLLARSDEWVFPAAIPGCCDNALPVEWSSSDLASEDLPKWGNQGGVVGPGVYTVSGTYTLQTHTFEAMPEPSSAMLVAIGVAAAAFRRRRVAATE